MKISKFVQLVKRRGYCCVVHTNSGEILLSNGAALYKAPGLPDMRGEEQIRTVLDIEPGQARKIYIQEDTVSAFDDVFGMDLTDGMSDTASAKKIQSAAFVKGIYAQALEADDGELIFYNEDLLSPLSDRMKESEYIELAVRKTQKGQRFIVVLDGFEVLAGIMPVSVTSEEYLKELQKFEQKVYAQVVREKQRELDKAAKAEGQTELFGKEKNESQEQDFDPETGEIFGQQTIEDYQEEADDNSEN